MEPGRIKITIMAATVFAVMAVEAAMAAVASLHLVHPYAVIVLGRLAEIGLIWEIVNRDGRSGAAIGLAEGTRFAGFRQGLVWSAGFAAAAGAGALVMNAFGVDPFDVVRAGRIPERVTLILFFLAGGLVSPVAEEFFFRGVLYGFFRRWGIAAALAASTAVFFLAHMPGPGVNYTQAVGGVVFALAYEVSGSLMTPIVIHVLGNLAIFTLGLILAA